MQKVYIATFHDTHEDTEVVVAVSTDQDKTERTLKRRGRAWRICNAHLEKFNDTFLRYYEGRGSKGQRLNATVEEHTLL